MHVLCALFTVGLAFSHRRPRSPKYIDWCQYWNGIGVERPECAFKGRENITITTTEAPLPVLPTFSMCTRKYYHASCKQDLRCDSSLLCMDIESVLCCHPPRGVCPTTVQLGFNCVVGKENNQNVPCYQVKNPQNWCHTDDECGPRGRCCPTGCDYNICV